MAAYCCKTRYRCIFSFPRIFSRLLSSAAHKSQTAPDVQFSQLEKRVLLRVQGADCVKLLHGLVTNNVELFHQDVSLKAMFGMFLNAQGRVLYDALFYKDRSPSEGPAFLIECDKTVGPALLKHLKIYKLRSKVEFSLVEDIIPWVVFSSEEIDINKMVHSNDSHIVNDPRVKSLGARLLLSKGATPPDCLSNVNKAQGGAYEEHRAKLGICEGTEEITVGSAMPLEYNLAYLHGVSFQKGCYVGQELTARTHHTGVIRKRIMPFSVSSHGNTKLQPGLAVKTENGKAAGKVCIIHGQYGLAMIRLANLKAGKLLAVDAEGNSVEIVPYAPKWWPMEEQKGH